MTWAISGGPPPSSAAGLGREARRDAVAACAATNASSRSRRAVVERCGERDDPLGSRAARHERERLERLDRERAHAPAGRRP